MNDSTHVATNLVLYYCTIRIRIIDSSYFRANRNAAIVSTSTIDSILAMARPYRTTVYWLVPAVEVHVDVL